MTSDIIEGLQSQISNRLRTRIVRWHCSSYDSPREMIMLICIHNGNIIDERHALRDMDILIEDGTIG